MNITLRTQVLAGLTSLCVIALGAAATMFWPHAPSSSVAQLLPAESITALISDPTTESIATFGRFSVAMRSLPTDDTSAVLAGVQTTDAGGSIRAGWIRFRQGNNGQPAIDASDDFLLTLLNNGKPTLADDDTFRSLSSSRTAGTPWAYVRSAQAGSTSFPIPANQALALSASGSSVSVSWIENERRDSLPTNMRDVFSTPVFGVQAGSLRDIVAAASSTWKDAARLGYDGRLRAWFADTFGSDTSMTYALLPLLNEEASLQLGRMSATGALIGLLEGETRDDADDVLDVLHKGFASGNGGAVRMQRTFDEKFDFDNIRSGGGQTEQSEEQVGGWTVKRTDRAGGSFVSAVNGRRFIIGTNYAAVTKALSIYPDPSDSAAVLRGYLDPSAVRARMNAWLPGEPLPLPSILLDGSGVIQWEVVRSGDLNTLVVQ